MKSRGTPPRSPLSGSRVVGIETEYLVSCIPAREEPPRWLLLNAVEEAIVKTGRVCDAAGGGYFLSNGGAVSFESRLERRDNPVIELATPECSNPWEILLYVRAQEHFLQSIARRGEATLMRHGYPGRIIFGRSNEDWRGECLGSHENYWIRWREAWPRALVACLLAALTGVLIGAINAAFVVAAHTALSAATIVRRLLRRSAPGRKLIALGEKRHAARSAMGLPRASFLCQWLRQAAVRTCVVCLEPLFDRVFFRRLRRDLVPFLASRQVYSGGGALRFDQEETPVHLSARARHIKRVCGISFGQRSKAVFDLKPLLLDPLGALRARKRLCVAGGDSLMCEGASFLALGATSLVLTMIEEGERFREVHLRRPVAAWRSISARGPLARLRTRSRKGHSALEIQRHYLTRAKTFFADAPRGSLPDQILRLWEGTLESLAENPAYLWGQVDWVTKKTLLDRVVFPATSWKTMAQWGALFEELRRSLPHDVCLESLDCREAHARLGRRKRRAFASLLTDEDAFGRQRALYLAACKLELGYHEVSRRGGYFQQLRREGEIVSLIDEDDALAAQLEPPSGTRAFIRGRAIALAQDPRDLEASWDTIRVNSLNLSVTIRDPLAHLPEKHPLLRH